VRRPGRTLPLLWLALVLQALLLLPRLDLLPLWDDERYTLATASRSPAGIIRAVEVDVHPPLYYLLMHAWLRLPLPGSEIVRARAFSALLALAATAVFWGLCLRQLSPRQQALFLGLWVLSPCVVLYARIARSYTLQLLLGIIALRLAWKWLKEPDNLRAGGGYVVCATTLLYTHYVPGLAVAGATAAVGIWRRPWRHLAALAAIALLYAPWIGRLARSATLVAETGPHRAAPNWLADHALKLGYAFVAFHFGETTPLWALAAALVLTPVIVFAWRRAWPLAEPPPLLLPAAAIGYVIAASWVSFAFVGARLLFLLPFYYLFLIGGLDGWRPGRLAYAGLLLVAVASLGSYYRRQDFLNKGYLVDYDALTQLVQQGSQGSQALVLLDRSLAGAGFALHGPYTSAVRILAGEPERQRALARIDRDQPALVWYLHYSRESPEAAGRLAHALEPHYEIQRHGFVPYAALDRRVMQWLGIRPPPEYVVEVLEFRRKS
jgi:hypothetical protein